MTDIAKEQINAAELVIREVLDRIGILYTLEFQEEVEDGRFIVKTADSALLIGENGKNLAALNYLLKRIVEKKYQQGTHFLVDVNDYHKKRTEEIRDLARMHAQRVRYFKKDVEMPPMNAYERRIIHTVLQEYPDITTESAGTGQERHVVIKPLSMVS